ncbi:unnamed protein product [Sphagnum tenellum]
MKTGEGNVGGGDGSNNTTATAAKVAAEVAPNVVTGGIVAETGPRPDFSLWTVEDDLLLKNAVEVGAAMEALAKGAMRFSRKFTVRELRERWRALLYDPEIAAQAASRMVEAEAALSNLPPNPKSLNEHRNTKVLARKRRARSIRSLYYKKRKRMAAEKLVAAVMLENELESDFMTGDEMAEDIVHGEQGGTLQPILPSRLEEKSLPGGLLSPKEPTTDFEEPTFSEMVSLLAAGECQHSGHFNGGPNIPKNIQETDPASDVIRTEQPRIQVAEEDGITFNPEDPLHTNDPTCKSAVTVREQLNTSGELSDISSRLLNTKCAPSKAKTEAEIATPPSCPETIEEDKLASESMVEKLEDTDNGCSGQQEGMVEEKGDAELNASSHDEDFSMSVPDDELLHHDSPMLDVDYSDPEDATDHIHNQPVGLGSIICILNMQDTEIPILDEVLPLPVWAMPPSPSEEVDEEEEDDIYHMEQTTPTDATMASRSPGMFYDLEEVGPPHMLELKGEPEKEEDEEEEKGISCSGTQLPQLGTVELGEHCSNFGILQKIPPSGPGIVLSLPQYTTEHTTLLATEAENFPSDFDPSTCQEVLAGMGASREVSSCREDTDHLLIEEEEPESEAEMARFSDVETMIINMDLDPGVDDEFSARAESRQMYRQQRRTLLRLEQGVGAAMQRNLTNQKALAILYGRHLRYYITKTKVLMGRGTHDNAVDIDLWKEGRANKVSRQQASLKLKEDGVFYLRNLGRRSLTVNNNAVETGQRAILGSNCLIEVGGMRFIFEINKRLVKQQVEQMREQDIFQLHRLDFKLGRSK